MTEETSEPVEGRDDEPAGGPVVPGLVSASGDISVTRPTDDEGSEDR